MEGITNSEIALAMVSLLLVFMLMITEHWAVGIIVFAILYHAFMYSRKPIIISSDNEEIKGE